MAVGCASPSISAGCFGHMVTQLLLASWDILYRPIWGTQEDSKVNLL